MKRKTVLPELLAPAGNLQAFYAAVEAGADAVYLGIAEGATNARVGAENFTRESLATIIPYAHANGVRVYLTLNTMVYENEMADVLSLARFAEEAGVDALIVADLGLARRIAKELPRMPLHASTQTFTHSSAAADELYKCGFCRVVLARESRREDMQSVVENAKAEVEVFVHGALCVSHSGQCLYSSLVGGRSGNRGACAQPCRMAFSDGKYPLSLKDLSLAAHIPSLIADGVASLKIEGRMKSAAYVYTVTRIFRRLLDERRRATPNEMRTLAEAFSRSGFTDGYYTGKLSDMTGIRRESDKQASRALEEKTFSPLPIPVTGKARLQKDLPAEFSLTVKPKKAAAITVSAEGDTPLIARQAALTREAVQERYAKLGADGLSLVAFTQTLDEGLFLPVGALNAHRRAVAEKLTQALRYLREDNDCRPAPDEEAEPLPFSAPKTAVFFSPQSYTEKASAFFDICFLPIDAFETPLSPLPNGVLLPPVLFDREREEVRQKLFSLVRRGVRYALVENLGEISLAKEAGLIPLADHRFNAANQATLEAIAARGVAYANLSPELSILRARRLSGGYIVYGRIPLMLTERCFIKENFGCEACGRSALTDTRGARFPMLKTDGHRNLIFNSLPTYLGDSADISLSLASLGKHFVFSTESAAETDRVITAYQGRRPLPFPVRRAYK